MISKNRLRSLFIYLNIANYNSLNYLRNHADDPKCSLPDTIHQWSYFSNTYDNGKNYGIWYTLPDQKADAFSFANYCGSPTDDSNMARIFNQKENDFLTENLLTNVKQAWIGGYYLPIFTKNQTSSGWFWIDQKFLSESVPVLYSNWKTGRPLDNPGKQFVAIYGDLANKNNGNFPSFWREYEADNEFNFICEVRCQLGQGDDRFLLDWDGEMRSVTLGDPVTSGMGVIPVLPLRFGIKVTAVYDSETISNACPLNLGHWNVCQNGNDNPESDSYGPQILWYDNGGLYIYFQSRYTMDFYSSFNPNSDINLENGNEMTLELKIYEDKFYANYTIDGDTLLINTMNAFDYSICEFSSCGGGPGDFKRKEQYKQGC